MFFERIAFFRADDVEVINVIAVGRDLRGFHVAQAVQEHIIVALHATPGFRPARQVRHLHVQNGCLQAVHAAVDSFHDMFAFAAVPGVGRHPIGELIVVRDGGAPASPYAPRFLPG